MSGNARNSFFAGHVALVGTSTFFTAKVFSDYHPDSKLRYLFWGAAAVATGATGYLRHRAGKHFPSDVLIGTAVGTLSGILVPTFHKTKLMKKQNFTLIPFSGQSHGLAMVYRL
jgi:membrane-associated phospholipid phosphatase